MRTSKIRFVAIAALAVMVFAACSSSSKGASSNTTATTTATTTPPAASGGGSTTAKTTVALASTKLGKVLVNTDGMTLYIDQNDKPGAPACTGACLTAWPPVPAPASATFGAGLTASKYSSVTLSDGTKQLTVNGSPLYTWMGDKAAGDVTGQGVNGFHVVMASGN